MRRLSIELTVQKGTPVVGGRVVLKPQPQCNGSWIGFFGDDADDTRPQIVEKVVKLLVSNGSGCLKPSLRGDPTYIPHISVEISRQFPGLTEFFQLRGDGREPNVTPSSDGPTGRCETILRRPGAPRQCPLEIPSTK